MRRRGFLRKLAAAAVLSTAVGLDHVYRLAQVPHVTARQTIEFCIPELNASNLPLLFGKNSDA